MNLGFGGDVGGYYRSPYNELQDLVVNLEKLQANRSVRAIEKINVIIDGMVSSADYGFARTNLLDVRNILYENSDRARSVVRIFCVFVLEETMFRASTKDQVRRLRKLVQQCEVRDINFQTFRKEGMTLLDQACLKGSVNVMRFLIRIGFPIQNFNPWPTCLAFANTREPYQQESLQRSLEMVIDEGIIPNLNFKFYPNTKISILEYSLFNSIVASRFWLYSGTPIPWRICLNRDMKLSKAFNDALRIRLRVEDMLKIAKKYLAIDEALGCMPKELRGILKDYFGLGCSSKEFRRLCYSIK